MSPLALLSHVLYAHSLLFMPCAPAPQNRLNPPSDGDRRSSADGPGAASDGLPARTAVPDAYCLALYAVLAAERAGVGSMLRKSSQDLRTIPNDLETRLHT